MKMTMHIDEELLARVISLTGAASKTEAVDTALREMDRKARLAEYGRKGLGLTREELMASVDPNYDIVSLRVAEEAATTPYATATRKVTPRKRKG